MGLSHPRYVSWAAQDGRLDDLTFHLARGGGAALRPTPGTANAKLNWPLHWAAIGGHAHCIQLLCEAGSELDPRNRDGHTPLHLATFHQHCQCAEALLQRGASPRTATRFGVTPLHLAAAVGSGPLLELLVRAGAAVDCQESWGQTPLAIAVQKARLDCLSCLLRLGADMEVSDHEHGHTPLHIAVATGNCDSTLLLLDAGARVSAVDRRGLTVVGVALTHRHYQLLPLLVEYGATAREADLALMSSALRSHFDQETGSPRSLQRLCRVAVRQYLSPHQVDRVAELPLPRQLVQFVEGVESVCQEGDAVRAMAVL